MWHTNRNQYTRPGGKNHWSIVAFKVVAQISRSYATEIMQNNELDQLYLTVFQLSRGCRVCVSKRLINYKWIAHWLLHCLPIKTFHNGLKSVLSADHDIYFVPGLIQPLFLFNISTKSSYGVLPSKLNQISLSRKVVNILVLFSVHIGLFRIDFQLMTHL